MVAQETNCEEHDICKHGEEEGEPKKLYLTFYFEFTIAEFLLLRPTPTSAERCKSHSVTLQQPTQPCKENHGRKQQHIDRVRHWKMAFRL